ncbi:hypothetical protein [Arthrobacter sp. KK5.5]|uniref:hypothetical protein n=1 Tax=Arthrobacter sp. KK5.5 TaxID=3373084 RepID=UPI003EE72E95
MHDPRPASFRLRTASGSVYLLEVGAHATLLARFPAEAEPMGGWDAGSSSLRGGGERLPVLSLVCLQHGGAGQFLLDLRGNGVPTIRTTSALVDISPVDGAGFLASARAVWSRDPLGAMVLARLAAAESGLDELLGRIDVALPSPGESTVPATAEATAWIELVDATLADEGPTPVGSGGRPLRPTALERMIEAAIIPARRQGVSASQWVRELAGDRVWRRIEAQYGLLDASAVQDLEGAEMLMGAERNGSVLYPGFQLVDGRVRPLMGRLKAAADELLIEPASVLMWMTAPTTQFGAASRPVDHLDDGDAVIRAFRNHFGIQW